MAIDASRTVFVIAEAGVNHNGRLALAKRLVDVAARSGADAVKFQAFDASTLVTKTAPRARYQERNAPGGNSQYDMLRKLQLPASAFAELHAHCLRRNVVFLATPFDAANLDYLVNALHVPAIKISSGDLTNGPLLLRAARHGRPLFLSTGMSGLGEIEEALGIIAFGYSREHARPSSAKFRRAYASRDGHRALREKVILLQCTSEYPAPMPDVNLRTMETLRDTFGLEVGFSDHTQGIEAAIAAVALGATVIEKHFTLDRKLPGPDHMASIEPAELLSMVTAIRNVTAALGSTEKRMTPSERPTAEVARKSLVALTPIARGARFSPANLGAKRPGLGVSPARFWDYLDRVATRDYQADEAIDP